MSIEKMTQIWPEWTVEKLLGRGSFGEVYKVVRKDPEHHLESYAAIKVISIPQNQSEVDTLRSEGLDLNGSRTYLQRIVNDFIGEIQLMESLKGMQNIVSVEDYKVVEKTNEIGWDILIRMELLTPFNTYISDKKLSESEVIKLGIDICSALEICNRRNIIHRDIKPENIFINDFGYFKLGDFGIARKLENMTSGLSQKGTFNYMAPEVANSSYYDARADIYSLGLVLFKLLNKNRLPFLDSDKQLLNPNDRRVAVERRIRGDPLPSPCQASEEMAKVILRACAFDPNQRFATATDMKNALLNINSRTVQPHTDPVPPSNNSHVYPEQTAAVRRPKSLKTPQPDPERTAAARRSKSPETPQPDPERTAAVRRSKSPETPQPDPEQTAAVRRPKSLKTPQPDPEQTAAVKPTISANTQNQKKRKTKKTRIIAALIAFLVVIGIGIFVISKLFDNASNTLQTEDVHEKDTDITTENGVPDVLGLTETEARSSLEALGLSVSVELTPADGAHTGMVLSMDQTSDNSVKLLVGEFTNFTFIENEDGLTLTGGPTAQILNLPDTINCIPITAIGAYVFAEGVDCAQGIYQVHFPKNLKRIEEGAFCSCLTLSKVDLPDSVTIIEDSAFWGCSAISEFHISENIVSIGDYAFQYCYGIPEIILPESCRSIGLQAFEGCIAVKRIDLPVGLTEIGAGAFSGCFQATLYVTEGSLAQQYAEKGDIPYEVQ